MMRPQPIQNQAFAGLVGSAVGHDGRVCLHAGGGLSRLGEPESRTVFYTLPWAPAVAGRGHGLHWHVGLAGLACPVVLPIGVSGGCRAAVHDARLLHSQNLARHAGGGQFAVLGHCAAAIYSVVLFK